MIVSPMVGRSRRFLDADYKLPKYRLDLLEVSVFSLAAGSFREIAQQEDMLIVCLKDDQAADFARAELERTGIARGRVVELSKMTSGQADTVSQGIAAAAVGDVEPLLIFNIDTFRPGFCYPAGFDRNRVDGYLECFIGQGANWSNVVTDAPGSSRVIRTSEKKQESERAYRAECAVHARGAGQANELYVAPIYNHLIAEGADIRVQVVPTREVIFCGVPAEYEALQASPPGELQRHAAALKP